MSRCTIRSSAIAGMPGRPSMVAVSCRSAAAARQRLVLAMLDEKAIEHAQVVHGTQANG